MKKSFILLSLAFALVACQNKDAKKEATANEPQTEATAAVDTLQFSGEIPAADGPGVRYDLSLVNDSSNTFKLTQTYLEAKDGKDEVLNYEGKAEKVVKKVDGKEKTAYKFALGKDDAVYFLQVNDSTLRMVNEELEEAVGTELNYDLKKK
ncbi:MAG: copper resistance protein NlpE N-terminal domain-containing protein [Prevotella sp.]|nr:copper resistance protein NlpE [Prevotella sp.]MDY4217546.1 copper resistance protein NlpE N-terminal domain-containing protein [Prevotella sp.]